MPLKKIENKPITIPEVKEVLENLNRELNQLQRRTLDYATAFSKLDSSKAKELCLRLVDSFNIDLKTAVQIVNCMPESIEELRVFFPRHRLIEPEKLQNILKLLDEYRGKGKISLNKF